MYNVKQGSPTVNFKRQDIKVSQRTVCNEDIYVLKEFHALEFLKV